METVAFADRNNVPLIVKDATAEGYLQISGDLIDQCRTHSIEQSVTLPKLENSLIDDSPTRTQNDRTSWNEEK